MISRFIVFAMCGALGATASTDMEEDARIGDAWSDPRNPIVEIFKGQRLELWSLQPVRRPEMPAGRSGASAHPIDLFISARLAEAELELSPEADKRTLARRVYYSLTGLPPSPEKMEAFLADDAPDAYARLVDRLLASPRYGEHWARQWLDVIRYSDSNGFDWDEFRPHAWKFRDYVIRSFNGDKPFDEFIREQLAGDELVDGPPENERERDRLIATGYLRLGPQDNSAPLFDEQSRARAEWMADLTETTASAFLGLTMSCSRCHDHKYDPISQVDHFRLRAFFEPLKYADDLPVDLADEQAAIREHNDAISARIKPLKEELDQLVGRVKGELRTQKRSKLEAEEVALLDLDEEAKGALTPETRQRLEEIEKKVAVTDDELMAALSESEKPKHDQLKDQINKLRGQRRSFTHGLLATDSTDEIAATRVHYQGDHKDEREAVVAGFLSALDPNPARIEAPVNDKTTGRRLALANWIVSPKNPLTARVLVNRVWQGHFGRGLVGTPNDFGLAGDRPTHPELIDWLASEFVRNDWSLKQLHRLIVTSATYRQTSAISPAAEENDPANRLYSRSSLRRLTAEQLRDSMLLVAGRLQDRNGGKPEWPELPKEILQANPAFLDDNAEKTKGWYPTETERRARSIFLVQKRTVRTPFMETFDLPSNEISCGRRQESIVAPQAFALLNSTLAVDVAKGFAERVRRESGRESESESERGRTLVRRVFAIAFQRGPSMQEEEACVEMLERHGLEELCRALVNLNEFVFVD